MKAGQLKVALKSVPDEFMVILQKDPEGNGYSPLYQIYTETVYAEETEYSGEVYDRGDVEAPKNVYPCIILVPTN